MLLDWANRESDIVLAKLEEIARNSAADSARIYGVKLEEIDKNGKVARTGDHVRVGNLEIGDYGSNGERLG